MTTTQTQVRSTEEALKALIHEMEYVLSCINEDKIPFDGDDFHEALRLGKEALAQPEQEPVAWMNARRDMTYLYGPYSADDIPLYTTPPQRPSRSDIKPLTDEQVQKILEDTGYAGTGDEVDFICGLRHGEAAHGITSVPDFKE